MGNVCNSGMGSRGWKRSRGQGGESPRKRESQEEKKMGQQRPGRRDLRGGCQIGDEVVMANLEECDAMRREGGRRPGCMRSDINEG